jgi:starvation-inducible DNA-binding protein
MTELNQVLSDTYLMYFKAHSYHWNVEGPNFPQYHEFFGNLYEELFSAVDVIAEQIRALGEYAPVSLAKILTDASLDEDTSILTPEKMFSSLSTANDRILVSLMQAYQKAEADSEIGLSDFLQGRIDVHNKHGWMLRATGK